MNRKVYCNCDSDFASHYQQQAGTGLSDLSVFRGQPYQRGYGFGSTFLRFGIPILKFLGKHLIKTGVNVGKDILQGNELRASIKSKGKEGIRNATKEGLIKLSNLIDQSGTGIRKRKRKKVNKVSKRITKDIFS